MCGVEPAASDPSPTSSGRALVTGASGYIGGRLAEHLVQSGRDVVCMSRRPGALADRRWHGDVELRVGDLFDPDSLDSVLDGIEVAYYLVHSMGDRPDFAVAESEAAGNFLVAAERAGVQHIVYLGGLGDGTLSKHLASRQETGRVLASGSIPVTELRAAVVIGAGSLSFEMLRSLTDVLPVMTTPRWVRTRCQPIAIEDVLRLLDMAGRSIPDESRIVEIGGPDVLTYQQMMRLYARAAGLGPRLIIPIPVLSPGLSSLWIGLVTPLPAATARPLVSSLRNEVTVSGDDHLRLLGREPIPFVEAVTRALPGPGVHPGDPASPQPGDPPWSGGTVYVEVREARAEVPPEVLAAEFMTIGGKKGYYAHRWAWRLRGWLDRLVGGPGMRRGRSDPDHLEVGDAVDFWHVEAVEPGRRLLLRAEMRLPGDATLEFVAEPAGKGALLTQTAWFRPHGLLGRLYWLAMFPFHSMIFSAMARRIAREAEARAGLQS
jgi:uncharacterized protein YbjT (DUF2867 family)